MATRPAKALGFALSLLLAAPVGAATITYIHTDALGSPVLETNQAGQVVRQVDYRAWGQEVLDPPKDGPAFTGHYRDSTTGLVYMQQRYYDPSVGRFLSTDPVTPLADPVMMFNRYHYAANNPYKYIDPDGRCPMQTGSRLNCGTAGAPVTITQGALSPGNDLVRNQTSQAIAQTANAANAAAASPVATGVIGRPAADGVGPDAPFKTKAEAAQAGIAVAAERSTTVEYGGAIVPAPGGFYATSPVTIGDPNDFRFTLDRIFSLAGIYHTHPSGGWYANLFSPTDIAQANHWGVPSFVGFMSDRSIRLYDPGSMRPQYGRGPFRIPHTRGKAVCEKCF